MKGVNPGHRYEAARDGRPERLASGSDDFTMFLWEPSTAQKPIARMTGHLQLINQVTAQLAPSVPVHVAAARPWHKLPPEDLQPHQ